MTNCGRQLGDFLNLKPAGDMTNVDKVIEAMVLIKRKERLHNAFTAG